MKKYYHATDFDNLGSILDKGVLPNSIEGIVYLTEEPTDAIKFLFIRGIKTILVVEVELNESEVTEQFDHNQIFFKCKAFGYGNIISTDQITNYLKYEL